ncbi:MAG: DUF924 family protein [Pigmentiphaga sp.]
MQFQEVLKFWFEEITPEQWWVKDDDLDARIRERFGAWAAAAAACELDHWRNTPQGRLAEILLLDQFPRNIHRNTPQAFASDALALGLTQEAIAAGADSQLTVTERHFLYLPFMHSESPRIHERAVRLFTQLGLPVALDFELQHQRIIERFGRYPHRNAILGRTSTPNEIAFLEEPGSSF